MNKIFFFDMDGTILNDEKKVLKETEDALSEAREKGHKASIATGRPYSEIISNVNPNYFDYLMANNGAYYYDVKAKTFHSNGVVNKDVARLFLDISIETRSIFAVHCNGAAFRGKFYEEYEGDKMKADYFTPTSIEIVRKMIEKYDVAQISLQNDSDILEKIVKDNMNNLQGSEAIISNGVFLDIIPNGVSKLSGIHSIIEKEGMKIEQVVSFGDSGNDLQMLKGSGIGISMGNAIEGVKSISDMVIGDNNTPTIAETIHKLID